MPREIWVSHFPKAGLQRTQLQGLFIGLTEHEQEMISGGGQLNGQSGTGKNHRSLKPSSSQSFSQKLIRMA
jgi:hypothetical protein